MTDLPVTEPATTAALAAVLAQAARRLHGEPDLHRLVTWAVGAASSLASDARCSIALVGTDGRASWWQGNGLHGIEPETDLGAVFDLRRALVDGHRIEVDGSVAGLPTGDVAVLPIRGAGAVIHGLIFLDPADRGRDDGIAALADHLGAALDTQARTVELEASRGELVHRLQEAVLPPTPDVFDTELGRHYSGAESTFSTGGDLYDWLVLPDGQLYVCVVDIMGKGVAATKDALAVTHTLRMLTLDGCSQDDLIRRADAILANQNPELVATVVVVRYDPVTGRVLMAGGGHPPALLVEDGGKVTELVSAGIPIGWPGAGSYGVTEVQLNRNDSIILYTDGLIESTRDILEGISRLSQFASETATYPATHQARALVDRVLAGAVRRDDSLAVVLRRRNPPPGSTSHPLAPFEYRFTPSTAAVSIARHLLEEWLVRFPVPEGDTGDLLLVASELVSNAVRHATGAESGAALRAWADQSDVIIEVEDDGGGPAAWPVPDDVPPDPELERGRGLFLVHALSDSVEMESAGGVTRVRCRKRSVLGTR